MLHLRDNDGLRCDVLLHDWRHNLLNRIRLDDLLNDSLPLNDRLSNNALTDHLPLNNWLTHDALLQKQLTVRCVGFAGHKEQQGDAER